MAEKRILVVTPDRYSVGVVNEDWSVALKFDLGGELGLFPELDLVLRLEPKEALALADVLQRKAGEALARHPLN
ncbi:MAG TPA: hypothetical protein VFC54_10215 [Pseudolabrys sp.]|nr:hypothetical protein [Pseudolabrys sp.]